MATYVYAKYVDTQELMADFEIAGYASYITSMVRHGKTLTIVTKYDLTPEEERIFRELVIKHSPIDPAVAAVQPKVDSAIEFGRSIIAEYAASNSVAKLPLPVVEQILIQLLPIQAALQSGSLYTALDMMTKIPPSPYLSPTTMKYFINKIRRYLKMPTI